MKKTLLIMVMALAVLLTQCRKPEVKFPSPVAPEGTTVSMTVTAGPGSKTDITAAGGITWSNGDKLYVGDGTKYVGYLTIVSGEGTPTGTFSGDVTLTDASDGEKTFGFFYLGNAARTLAVGATSAVVDFSSQNIYAEDGKLKNASAQHVGYGSASGTVKDGVVTGINVTLVSKVALARFSFTESDSKGGAYTGALTLSGDGIYNSMTVGFGGSFTGNTKGNISLRGSHSERYVMLVPTNSTDMEILKFGGGASGTTTLENGIESNKFYGRDVAIGVEVTPQEYVDLGLPSGLLWATCNLGASKPEDYGDYYAWGEIEPYYADGHSQDNPCSTWRSMTTGAGNTVITNGYSWKTYSQGGSSSFAEWTTKPYDVTTKVLTSAYDAATQNWGGTWRMPTGDDFIELIDNTTRTWYAKDNDEFNGVAGWKCANKSDATKYIFLPAAGRRDGTSLDFAGSEGYCRSSSLSNSDSHLDRYLRLNSGTFSMYGNSRYFGCTVRPVRGGATPEPPATPKFSVGSGTKVEFAPGNLYAKKTGTEWEWGFYEHQYDMNSLNSGGSRTATSGDAEIDLFTWGYGDWSTDPVGTTYQTGTFTDWGTIPSLPDNAGGKTWRTLSEAEWAYLLNTSGSSGRTDANRFAKAKVNDVNGMLIFPDGYTLPEGYTTADGGDGMAKVNKTSESDAPWPADNIPTETWTSMEAHGVVFLPAAGGRYGTVVGDVGSGGGYWSSTPNGSDYAYFMGFNSGNGNTYNNNRNYGGSVRLVRSAS